MRSLHAPSVALTFCCSVHFSNRAGRAFRITLEGLEKISGTNKRRRGLSWRPAILSPLPPCLAGRWAQPTDRSAAPLLFPGHFDVETIRRPFGEQAGHTWTERHSPSLQLSSNKLVTAGRTREGAHEPRRAANQKRPGTHNDDGGNYAIGCRSRGRALRPKNSA